MKKYKIGIDFGNEMKPDNHLKLLYGIFIGLVILLIIASITIFNFFKIAID